MNKTEAKNLIGNFELIKAFSKGETIQYNGVNGWQDGHNLAFLEHPDLYRLKPKPIELEIWYRDLIGNPALAEVCRVSDEVDEDFMKGQGFQKIKVREIE